MWLCILPPKAALGTCPHLPRPAFEPRSIMDPRIIVHLKELSCPVPNEFRRSAESCLIQTTTSFGPVSQTLQRPTIILAPRRKGATVSLRLLVPELPLKSRLPFLVHGARTAGFGVYTLSYIKYLSNIIRT